MDQMGDGVLRLRLSYDVSGCIDRGPGVNCCIWLGRERAREKAKR